MKMSSIVGKELPIFSAEPDDNRPCPDTAVGIEIEVENVRLMNTNLKYWTVTGDGSLQNGLEFVSHPIWGTAITDALEEVDVVLKKSDPYLSFRTSVHVHINVLDMEPEQLAQHLKLYVMYEPALFRIHEEWQRYDNIFCVPARKSVRIQDGYANVIRDVKRGVCNSEYVGYKYSALNPNSISRFGTLEFRHMGGTADTEAISDWINVLLQLKKAADNMVDITDRRAVFEGLLPKLTIRDRDIVEGNELIDYINMKTGE